MNPRRYLEKRVKYYAIALSKVTIVPGWYPMKMIQKAEQLSKLLTRQTGGSHAMIQKAGQLSKLPTRLGHP